MAVKYTKRMNRYLQEHSQLYDPAVFCVIRKAAVYSSSDAAWLLLVNEQ